MFRIPPEILQSNRKGTHTPFETPYPKLVEMLTRALLH